MAKAYKRDLKQRRSTQGSGADSTEGQNNEPMTDQEAHYTSNDADS